MKGNNKGTKIIQQLMFGASHVLHARNISAKVRKSPSWVDCESVRVEARQCSADERGNPIADLDDMSLAAIH